MAYVFPLNEAFEAFRFARSWGWFPRCVDFLDILLWFSCCWGFNFHEKKSVHLNPFDILAFRLYDCTVHPICYVMRWRNLQRGPFSWNHENSLQYGWGGDNAAGSALVRKIFSGKQKGRVFSFRYVKRWHSERLRPKVIQIRQVHLWELNISNPNQTSKYQALTLLIEVRLAIGCLLEHLDNEMKESQGKEPLGLVAVATPKFAPSSPKPESLFKESSIFHWFATGFVFVLIVYLLPSS